MNHLIVFDAPMSKARATRIEKAILAARRRPKNRWVAWIARSIWGSLLAFRQ